MLYMQAQVKYVSSLVCVNYLNTGTTNVMQVSRLTSS